MGNIILFMFVVCLLLIFLIPFQRIHKMDSIIFAIVFLFSSFIFNDIIQESYSHYNSYKYLFIFAAFYFIFVNITKGTRYKYITFLASLCMGYILIILSLPIINLFRVYTIYGNYYFIAELMQSFIVTTLSFFLCEFVSFIGELFVLEETSKRVKSCILIKYLIHKKYLRSKLFRVKDRSSLLCKLKDIVMCALGYIFNPKKHKCYPIDIFFRFIYIIFIVIFLVFVYFSKPTRYLQNKLQYHNNIWHVLIDNTHNKLIKSSSNNYINGSERNIKTATLSHNNNRKYFYINNNKLYIRPNVLLYPHLGKIDKKSPLIFYGISHGAYHFSGVVNVKKNAHFSSKADINIYLSQHKSQLRMVRHDIRK